MKTRRAWLIVLAVAAVIAVNDHLSQRDRVASLEQQLAAAHGRQARSAAHATPAPWLAARPAAPAAERPAEVATAAPTAPGEPPPEPAASTERWEAEAQANQAAIERGFAAERVDEAWAVPVRLALGDRLALAARASLSSLGNTECRSSVCRVEVTHRDAEASRKFAEVSLSAPGEPSAFDSVFVTPPRPAPQGGFTVTMYLARDGAALLKR